MKNFRQIIQQHNSICSCLLTMNRLQMPKAMPTIPEEDEEEAVIYEVVYGPAPAKTKSDDDELIIALQGVDIGDDSSCSTCSSADFVLSASTSGEDSQLEWED